MKNILFVTTSLGGGGAERIMSYLLNYFSSDDEYQVQLLLLKNRNNDYLESISDKVEIYNLGLDNLRVRYAIFKILKKIYQLKPDVCFVGLSGLNILIAPFIPFFCHRTKFVVRETFVLSCRYEGKQWMRWFYKLFYNNYSLIVAQSDDMKKDMISNWGVAFSKCIKINNPVDADMIKARSKTNLHIDEFNVSCIKLLSIGRLTTQKNYSILLKRLSENNNMNFRLVILGRGELEYELKKQICQLGLSDKVFLKGFVQNPYAYLYQADALILSSKYEGFPNVLLEANALGRPVFANNCPGGINEIINIGTNGIIADFYNPKDFKSKFEEFVSAKFDPDVICHLTTQRYSFENILFQYKKYISTLF